MINPFKAYVSKQYWRQTIISRETLSTFAVAIGYSWLTIEVIQFMFGETQSQLQSLWTWFLFGSAVYTFWKRRPIMHVRERLRNIDVWIEIRVADMFSIPGAYIIPTNTSFETRINESLISAKSVQGIFTDRFYSHDEALAKDLANSLKEIKAISTRVSAVGGNSEQYEFGTVVKVESKHHRAYLIASAELNEHGTARTSLEMIKFCLSRLWGYLSEKGNYQPIVIPLLGAGHGRINHSKEQIVKDIVESFVFSVSNGRHSTKKLIIAIAPQDYPDINMGELQSILKYNCHYAENRKGSQNELRYFSPPQEIMVSESVTPMPRTISTTEAER